ncbi:MAG: RHS repeat-associated core domain-containing protein [Hyphomonadaceae bacterium]
MNYRARAYAPSLGRFMQTDPISYAGGPNLYTYVANNPKE